MGRKSPPVKGKLRTDICIGYGKVLNTVPTLGGVKSAFHEAKQESIILSDR